MKIWWCLISFQDQPYHKYEVQKVDQEVFYTSCSETVRMSLCLLCACEIFRLETGYLGERSSEIVLEKDQFNSTCGSTSPREPTQKTVPDDAKNYMASKRTQILCLWPLRLSAYFLNVPILSSFMVESTEVLRRTWLIYFCQLFLHINTG
jgi:hypothetical protein